MVTFKPSNVPITEQEIVCFEKRINSPLPSEYRQFMLKHNGGEFPNGVYRGIDECLVQPEFYPLLNATKNRWGFISEVNYWRFEDKERIESEDEDIPPNQYLKIGTDFIGNAICLSLKEETANFVYLYIYSGVHFHMNLISKSFCNVINIDNMEYYGDDE
jgi:hypothetical protein